MVDTSLNEKAAHIWLYCYMSPAILPQLLSLTLAQHHHLTTAAKYVMLTCLFKKDMQCMCVCSEALSLQECIKHEAG